MRCGEKWRQCRALVAVMKGWNFLAILLIVLFPPTDVDEDDQWKESGKDICAWYSAKKEIHIVGQDEALSGHDTQKRLYLKWVCTVWLHYDDQPGIRTNDNSVEDGHVRMVVWERIDVHRHLDGHHLGDQFYHGSTVLPSDCISWRSMNFTFEHRDGCINWFRDFTPKWCNFLMHLTKPWYQQ